MTWNGRRNIYIRKEEDKTWKTVEKLAKRKRTSVSQVIIEALKLYLRQEGK